MIPFLGYTTWRLAIFLGSYGRALLAFDFGLSAVSLPSTPASSIIATCTEERSRGTGKVLHCGWSKACAKCGHQSQAQISMMWFCFKFVSKGSVFHSRKKEFVSGPLPYATHMKCLVQHGIVIKVCPLWTSHSLSAWPTLRGHCEDKLGKGEPHKPTLRFSFLEEGWNLNMLDR